MSLEKIEARDAAVDLAILSKRVSAEVGIGDPELITANEFQEGCGRAFMMGARVAMNTMALRQPCRICGCWELEACDEGCGWAEPGLCTACAEPDNG